MTHTDGHGQARTDTAAMSRERLMDARLWLGLQEELGLSPRELDVAIRLVLGDSLSQIAGRFGITKGTVKTYCDRLKRKAKVADRTRLVTALLLSSGLLLQDGKSSIIDHPS